MRRRHSQTHRSRVIRVTGDDLVETFSCSMRARTEPYSVRSTWKLQVSETHERHAAGSWVGGPAEFGRIQTTIASTQIVQKSAGAW